MNISFKEVYKDVEGYGGVYKVSNFGNVKRNKRVLKPQITKDGELKIGLSIGGKKRVVYISRLVANAFVEKTDKSKNIVMHLDWDRSNNYYENLKWMSCSESVKYAWDCGRHENTREAIRATGKNNAIRKIEK